MKKAARIIVGISVVVAGGFAPVVPDEMEWLYSYQTTPEAIATAIAQVEEYKTANVPEAYKRMEAPPVFEDDDGNGVISVAVFSDKKGEQVFMRFPDAQYEDGKRLSEEGKGIHSNPKKQEYLGVFEALTPKAKGAIAYDNSASAQSANGATSLTYAVTIAASNEYLVVGAVDYGDYVTGMTYNGTSMTSLGSQAIVGGGGSVRAYGLANPSMGANNVVITKSTGSNFIPSVAGSYSGAAQTGQPEATGTNTASSASTLTVSATTLTDNAWMVLLGWNDNGGTMTASTGSTKRTQTPSYGGFALFDSNAGISPAGSNSMTYTSTFTGGQTGFAVVIKEPAVVITPTESALFIN